MKMTLKGAATMAMFNNIVAETYDRVMEWFKNNPDEPYCYWAKDTFIRIDEKYDKDILARHPEIEDIDDHTVVTLNGDKVLLTLFCPKLKAGIAEMFKNGYMTGSQEGTTWTISEDFANDNYNVIIERP